MRPPERVRGVLFDCDGTLADTERCWDEAVYDVAGDVSLSEAARTELLGGTVADVVACLRRLGHPQEETELAGAYVEAVIARERESARPMPGAVDLLAAVEERYPVAVASNSPRCILDVALAAAGFAHLRRRSVAADDVPRGKPEPDLYEAAARLIGVSPRDCVAFEDSPVGVEAAKRAGCFVIGCTTDASVILDAHARIDTLADPRVREWIGCAHA
ncbi:MAG: HAD family phosphatase [Actinomycetaceae bacterium]|nr:HAD family phosphatase [Actinomycetaceae bacterium]